MAVRAPIFNRRRGAPGAHLDSTTTWRLESRQNPHAGKRALRSAAFPGCGFAELSSSAIGARSRRTLDQGFVQKQVPDSRRISNKTTVTLTLSRPTGEGT